MLDCERGAETASLLPCARHRTCHPDAVLVAVPQLAATDEEQPGAEQRPGYLFVIVMPLIYVRYPRIVR